MGTGQQGVVTNWVLDLGVVPDPSHADHMAWSTFRLVSLPQRPCSTSTGSSSVRESEIRYPQLLLPVGVHAGRH